MRWRSAPKRHRPFRIVASLGRSVVAEVDFDSASGRFVALVLMRPKVFGSFLTRDRAQAFVEQELWAEAGELAAPMREATADERGALFWICRGSSRSR